MHKTIQFILPLLSWEWFLGLDHFCKLWFVVLSSRHKHYKSSVWLKSSTCFSKKDACWIYHRNVLNYRVLLWTFATVKLHKTIMNEPQPGWARTHDLRNGTVVEWCTNRSVWVGCMRSMLLRRKDNINNALIQMILNILTINN